MSEYSTSYDKTMVDCCCDKNISILFAKLDREKREAEIRLYGVLWYLVEYEIISQGKAMELARKSLGDIIGECIKWRENS